MAGRQVLTASLLLELRQKLARSVCHWMLGEGVESQRRTGMKSFAELCHVEGALVHSRCWTGWTLQATVTLPFAEVQLLSSQQVARV